jgi:hypothetical protein
VCGCPETSSAVRFPIWFAFGTNDQSQTPVFSFVSTCDVFL